MRPTVSRLPLALCAYMLAITLLITLAPFDFRVPEVFELSWAVDRVDVLANVVFFVPLGFLLGLSFPGSVLTVLACCLGASVLVELGQLFVPHRHTSPIDLLTNTLGAAIGLGIQRRFAAGVARRLEGTLALELPLMSLVYLLVPLLWLLGLGSVGDPQRRWLYPLLGLVGALVLASVWRHRLRDGGLGADHLAVLAGAWFLLGGLPGGRTDPVTMVALAAGVAVAARVACQLPIGDSGTNRFEVATLRWLWPLFLLYLVLLIHWPLRFRLEGWYAEMSLTEGHVTYYRYMIVELLEYTAAFTLAGYMIAETTGRRVTGELAIIVEIVLVVILFAGALELLRGFTPNHARLYRPLLAGGASAAGAIIYRRQLAELLRRRR